MDGFGNDYTASTSIKPNSPVQGNDVKKLSEEMDFKLKIAHEKRLAIKHFMSATPSSSVPKTSVPKKTKIAERNKAQTQDIEGKRCFPRSFSFDSKDSRFSIDAHNDIKNSLQPYDPIKNYLSPRPRFLKYNPDRHREIFARQKNVTRVRRSASYDAGMRFPEEELESSSEHSVEETEIYDTEHEHEHENENEKEREKEEQFDDFEEHNGWNSKVFLQYVLVMIVLILTTLAITSINSPTFSPTRESMLGFMNLYNKSYSSFCRIVGFNFLEVGKLSKREIDVNHDEVWTEDVADDNMDSNELEGFKTANIERVQNNKIDENRDEMWSKNNTGQFHDSQINKIEEKEEISYESHKPVILKREEIYSRLLGDDSIEVEVNEEAELLKMMVEEDVGKEDILTKLARFDQISVAFVGFCVLFLVSLSIIYYSKKSKISHQNSTNTKNLESFVKFSPLTHKTHSGSLTHSDTISSNEARSSYLEFSADSPSYGSFTIETTIVKKKKRKKPEVMLSPVRRSSRIHNRSVTPP